MQRSEAVEHPALCRPWAGRTQADAVGVASPGELRAPSHQGSPRLPEPDRRPRPVAHQAPPFGLHGPAESRAVAHLGEQDSTAPPWETSASLCFTASRGYSLTPRSPAYSVTAQGRGALGLRPSGCAGPMASRPSLRRITPHRPALRAGAGSGLGGPRPRLRQAPAPGPGPAPLSMPRDDPRFTLRPAKGRCTGPSLIPHHAPHHQTRPEDKAPHHGQQHLIRANPQRRFDSKAGAPRLRSAGLHRL